jgi:hypothetical protein
MEHSQSKFKGVKSAIKASLERYRLRWEEIKAKNEAEVESTVAEENVELNDRFEQIALRRKVLDWRDKHLTEIELHLMKELPFLMRKIDGELENLSTFDSTSGMGKVNQNIIQPMFNKWVEQQRHILLKNAETELQKIHDTVLCQAGVNSDIDSHFNQTHISDAFAGAALGVGGIVLVPVVSSASVVSVGGLLGLVGVTTLSLPVAVVGGLAAVSMLALGGRKFLTIKRNAQFKYRQNIGKKIDEFVFSKGNNKTKGLSFQLQSSITAASEQIIKGLTQ